MNHNEIPEETINKVAHIINQKNNKTYSIPIVGIFENSETPHVFEIVSFLEIDSSNSNYYAVDGSYNSQEFYNGLSVAVYNAGYICYNKGKQIRVHSNEDSQVLGKVYYPNTILLSNPNDYDEMYDELLSMEPVKYLLEFFGDGPDKVFSYNKEAICRTISSLLGFCQEILEWSLLVEILNLEKTKKGDFILRDGTLRSLNIKQEYLVKIGRHAHSKGIFIVGVTKKSPLKLELSYTIKQIDDYLQDDLRAKYEFKEANPRRQKLCCWFEVPMQVLHGAYKADSGNMYIKKSLTGGRGFGIFHIARLDYVEKLQNYDWLITDLNYFDVVADNNSRNIDVVENIHKELTRLTQEHYVLGYPYPLVDAHNFVSLKRGFKDEIINRVKLSLYKEKRMDHIDIENLFLDTHNIF